MGCKEDSTRNHACRLSWTFSIAARHLHLSEIFLRWSAKDYAVFPADKEYC